MQAAEEEEKKKQRGGFGDGGRRVMGRAMSKEEAGAGGQLLLCLLWGYRSSPDVEHQIEARRKEAERERQQRDVSDRRVLPTVARLESSCVFYKSHVDGAPSSVAGSGRWKKIKSDKKGEAPGLEKTSAD